MNTGRRQKNSARGEPGAGQSEKRAASLFSPEYIKNGRPCQVEYPDLATQARRRADQAGVMWEACRAAGDARGAAAWRRLQFKHQRILYELTHTKQNIAYEFNPTQQASQEVSP